MKLKNGLEIEIDENAFNNMEVLDSMRGMDEGNPFALSKFCDLVFSKEEKKKLYDFCRDEKGKVPVEKAVAIITEIMESLGKTEKN